MPPNFNGTESAEDVLKIALSEFSARSPAQRHRSIIVYRNNVPFLRYRSRKAVNGPEYLCLYRLDTMLLPFFEEAERAFDAVAVPAGVEKELREPLVRYLACFGMQAMLGRLMILQRELFTENFEEGKLVTSTFLLQSIVAATLSSQSKPRFVREASRQVKQWLDQVVEESMKKKRDFLLRFANAQPLLSIPTKAGRPIGATKSEAKKKQEAAEFEAKIEATIRDLYNATGAIPTKTAVAEALSSGPNVLRIFIAKTNHLEIDYEAIVERVRGSLNNSTN